MGDDTKVWPQSGLEALGDDSLSKPVTDLLGALHKKENDPAGALGQSPPQNPPKVTYFGGTPASLQIITAGASSLTKWCATFIAGVGGLGVVATAIRTFYGNIKDNSALLFSAAILFGAISIAIAIMVNADISARAKVTAARKDYHARVVQAFLNNYQFAKVDPAPATPPASPAPVYETSYAIQKDGPEWIQAKGFQWNSGELSVITDGDLVKASEITAIIDLRHVADQIRPAE